MHNLHDIIETLSLKINKPKEEVNDVYIFLSKKGKRKIEISISEKNIVSISTFLLETKKEMLIREAFQKSNRVSLANGKFQFPGSHGLLLNSRREPNYDSDAYEANHIPKKQLVVQQIVEFKLSEFSAL